VLNKTPNSRHKSHEVSRNDQAFVQATRTAEGTEGEFERSPTGSTAKFSARCTTAGRGLIRPDSWIVGVRTGFSSAIGLARPQRTITSFVVSSIRAPGLWKLRVAFSIIPARRNRFETCFMATNTSSERIRTSEKTKDLSSTLTCNEHLGCQMEKCFTIRKSFRADKASFNRLSYSAAQFTLGSGSGSIVSASSRLDRASHGH